MGQLYAVVQFFGDAPEDGYEIDNDTIASSNPRAWDKYFKNIGRPDLTMGEINKSGRRGPYGKRKNAMAYLRKNRKFVAKVRLHLGE